jgi:polysaccharide pyruvyl transferase WcaK-like protein
MSDCPDNCLSDESRAHTDGAIRVAVLGACFDTGNLGVNALAESTLKILLHRWPDAEIILFGSGYEPERLSLSVGNRQVELQVLPVRFCKKLRLPYHFLWFAWYGMVARLLPWRGGRERLLARNRYCRTLHEVALAADITGGDSFSDIYGMRRFLIGFLRKWLVFLYGKKLVMLPQTYGPFKRRTARALARYILAHAEAVYSRDRDGLDAVKQLLNGRASEAAKFSHDVAFVLDPREPEEPGIQPQLDLRSLGSGLVGLNVSGLLYHGGYTRDNMFGLTVEYRKLVREIAEFVLRQDDWRLLLVPHVFPGDNMDVESDPAACRSLYDELQRTFEGRVFLAAGRYSQNEIKSIIGRCDFFLGSRMHACIAALSQGIPAVGLAYSKKFRGVFESIGVEDCVVDLRHNDNEQVLAAVEQILGRRELIREHLLRVMPDVRQQALGIFRSIEPENRRVVS